MSAHHPLDDDVIAEQIDLASKDPDAASELAKVTTKLQANKVLWRLGRLLKELADAEAAYADDLERITLWIEGVRERIERQRSFAESLLTQFHRNLRAIDPSVSVVHLPSGDLVSRKAPDHWSIDDQVLVAWAAKNKRPDLVRTRPAEADRNAVKKAFAVVDGQALDEGGEVVPGIQIITGEIGYAAKPHGVQR